MNFQANLYYCNANPAIWKNENFVQDGNRYAYTTAFINAENPLGFVKATLKEYTLYKIAETELLIGKLYKTKRRQLV